MDDFQKFCDAVLNSKWNQDLDPSLKGKLALALLEQRELFDDIVHHAVADFAYRLSKQLNL